MKTQYIFAEILLRLPVEIRHVETPFHHVLQRLQHDVVEPLPEAHPVAVRQRVERDVGVDVISHDVRYKGRYPEGGNPDDRRVVEVLDERVQALSRI